MERRRATKIELLIVIAVLGALTAMMQLSSAGDATGNPTAAGFVTNSADFIYALTFDTIKSKFVIESDDSKSAGSMASSWYAKYTLEGSELTYDITKKLADRATTDGLYKDKGTTAYAVGTTYRRTESIAVMKR